MTEDPLFEIEAVEDLAIAERSKACSKCGAARPFAMFAPSKKSRDGLQGVCRVCQRIVTRIQRLGLDPAVAATPLAADGRCEVCNHEPMNLGLQLDHDHKTGKFRGWLCRACNLAIGMASDDPGRLRALADYLEQRAIMIVADPT